MSTADWLGRGEIRRQQQRLKEDVWCHRQQEKDWDPDVQKSECQTDERIQWSTYENKELVKGICSKCKRELSQLKLSHLHSKLKGKSIKKQQVQVMYE